MKDYWFRLNNSTSRVFNAIRTMLEVRVIYNQKLIPVLAIDFHSNVVSCSK